MNVYKIVHTGPKIAFGGLSAGFMSEAYQVEIEGKVNAEPSAAVP
jgi:hypothetical protein